jgi:hypothetical protein
MAHILREGTVKATEEQIKALQDQADALQRVGVVSKDAILIGQGQLASFDLQAKSIEALIPSILNYAVAENGANLSGEELKATTNGLAQALQGNFASLTKTGFVLDENTKKLISTGTETEKVEALVKVLDSTYNGLNERMRQTTEGGVIGLQFAVEDLKETLGATLAEAVTPFIVQLSTWASNPDVQNKVKEMSVMVGEFAKVAIPVAIEAIKLWKSGFDAIVNVIGEIIYQIDRAINAISRFITKVKESSIVKGATAAISSVSNAVNTITGARASGGPVMGGGSYLVGERGPEIFTPSGNGFITPNGGGAAITINISGNTLLDANAGEKIGRQVMDVLKNNLRI